LVLTNLIKTNDQTHKVTSIHYLYHPPSGAEQVIHSTVFTNASIHYLYHPPTGAEQVIHSTVFTNASIHYLYHPPTGAEQVIHSTVFTNALTCNDTFQIQTTPPGQYYDNVSWESGSGSDW